MIAIGIGCRKDCPSENIVALIQRAVMALGELSGPMGLFSLAGKEGEEGLLDAAQQLELPIAFLPKEHLAAFADKAVTRSEKVQALFGLPSIAETAALAGAGPGGTLIMPRLSGEGVSLAIAIRGMV
jgi:cobalt-precorrin 5A hydrolase